MMLEPSFHDAATRDCVLGFECPSCIRRSIVLPTSINATREDHRKIEKGGLPCLKCGSTNYSVRLFESRDEAYLFIRKN